MTLRLHDTLSRSVREFVPLVDGVASLYVCGPTVQSAPHIGHVRSAVAFDVLRRWLEASGYSVVHLRNVTDIDDKVLVNAEKWDMPWWALATAVTRQFDAAYQALNCLPPTGEPRATAHVPEMVALIARLVDRGHAYAAAGDVYFDVRSFPAYGALSGQRTDALEPTEDPTGKRDPLDFALWKGAKPGEPAWQTPWGPGRPGWHLECSAMATRYLGPAFDIHGGGLDLVFPHHENEIAQSVAAGDDFASYWLHHGMVNTGGAKMSKSLGNSLFAADLLERARPQALRYAFVAPHYRSVIDWSDQVLTEADTAYSRIESFLARATELTGDPADAPLPAEVVAAMDDDLSTPRVVAVLHGLVTKGNTALDGDDLDEVAAAAAQVSSITRLLGLQPADFQSSTADSALRQVVDALVPAMLATRQTARERKDFAESDRIRDALASAGVVVEDTAQGARWRVG
jgi:cysteinyl-tRNA synthetase